MNKLTTQPLDLEALASDCASALSLCPENENVLKRQILLAIRRASEAAESAHVAKCDAVRRELDICENALKQSDFNNAALTMERDRVLKTTCRLRHTRPGAFHGLKNTMRWKQRTRHCARIRNALNGLMAVGVVFHGMTAILDSSFKPKIRSLEILALALRYVPR